MMVPVALVNLAFAFFLMLFDANRNAAFTRWVYRSNAYVLEPFRGSFPVVREGGSVINFSILFAMLVHGLDALVVESLASWLDATVRKIQIESLMRQREAESRGVGHPTNDLPAYR